MSEYVMTMETPIGLLQLTSNEQAMTSILFVSHETALTEAPPILQQCRTELQQYFRGERTTFTVPYELAGTAFQCDVWRTLTDIPYGETWSYRQVATTIDRPKAVRAVGATNGKNQLSIIVPCHRVIGSDGTLTGYAGGLERKRWLLDHEKLNKF